MYNRNDKRSSKKIVTWSEGKACTICGQPMLEKHLSREVFNNAYEKKWCVHWACSQKIVGHLDRNTR